MKICITSKGKDLNSEVESKFGRSPYFIIYDTDTSKFEDIRNPNISETSGVGIQSGKLVADKKAKVVLTGKVGPKASKTLESAGIEIITDVIGTVEDVIKKYQVGSFKTSKETEKSSASSNTAGFGLGRGKGMGCRGQGRGNGKGFGTGPSGHCICPKCGKKVAHQPGVPCRSLTCSKCATLMVRD